MAEFDPTAFEKKIGDLVKTTVTDLVKPLADAHKALAENQKVLADTMAADAEAKKTAAATAAKEAADKAAAGGGADKPIALTEAEFNKRVTDAAAKLVDDRFKAQQTTAEQNAARSSFVAEKMKDLPEVYQAKLGADPAKWATEEQQIRDTAKADAARMGFVPKSVGGNQAGAGGGAGDGANAANNFNGSLTPGQAKFASEIKLPTQAQ